MSPKKMYIGSEEFGYYFQYSKYNLGFDSQFYPLFFRYFEFRICPQLAAKQSCLDKHVLELLGGTPSLPQPNDLKTRFYPRNGSRIYDIKARLPPGVNGFIL